MSLLKGLLLQHPPNTKWLHYSVAALHFETCFHQIHSQHFKAINHASITTGTKLPLTMWWSLGLLYRQVKWGMKRLVTLPEGFCLSLWHVVSSFSHLIVGLTCDSSSRLRDSHHKHHVANKHPNQLTHRIAMLAHTLLTPSQLPLIHQSKDKAVALASVISKAFLHPAKLISGLSGQLSTQKLLQNRELQISHIDK